MKHIDGFGLDLGTANCTILQAGQNPENIVSFRSVIARDVADPSEILAIGEDAYEMIGRVPEGVEVVHAVHRGNIANREAYLDVLKAALQDPGVNEFSVFWPLRALKDRITLGRRREKPVLVVGVPFTSSDNHRITIRDLIEKQIGARAVLMYEQVLDVIGERLAFTPESKFTKAGMLSDMGGGTIDNAVYTPEGFIYTKSHDIGGDVLDMEIIHGVRRDYNVRIGLRTAERLKIELASATKPQTNRSMTVNGKSAEGQPREVTIWNTDIYGWLKSCLEEIAGTVHTDLAAIEEGETHAEIKETGLTITGGGSLLENMAEYMAAHTGLKVRASAHPLASVALGASIVLQDYERYRKYDLVPKLPRERSIFDRTKDDNTVNRYTS